MFPGNGHLFRASNERNARTLLTERRIFASESGLLPVSVAGRVLLAAAVGAVLAGLMFL